MCVSLMCGMSYFFFDCYGDHRYLHVLTHSFPTRRSSDLHAGSRRFIAGFLADDRPLQRRVRGKACGTHWRPTYADDEFRFLGQSVGTVIALFRSEEPTSELQSLMRIPYAVFCLQKQIL